MAKLILKVKKIAFKHPQTKKAGFVARVVTNGTESFDDICEIAGMNTTYSQEDIPQQNTFWVLSRHSS